MIERARRFTRDQDGATTIDWVVLTAAVVALNIAVVVNLLGDGISVKALFINDGIEQAMQP